MIPAQRLRGLASLASLPADALEALAAVATEARFGTDEVIFLAGSAPRGWYVVLEGRVRVVRGGAGDRQHVIHTETAGGTLGEVPLFAGGTYPATGIASEPTLCALFTRSAIETVIARAPSVAFVLLQRLAIRVRGLVDRLDERSARSVEVRLCQYLLTRGGAAGGAPFSLGMTQQRLAEELGTVREVISRSMRGLIGTGLIGRKGNGKYEIRSREGLERRVTG